MRPPVRYLNKLKIKYKVDRLQSKLVSSPLYFLDFPQPGSFRLPTVPFQFLFPTFNSISSGVVYVSNSSTSSSFFFLSGFFVRSKELVYFERVTPSRYFLFSLFLLVRSLFFSTTLCYANTFSIIKESSKKEA